ncbi:receptor-type tyrosine-protein phosphatase eta isoform X2 [Centropristis striata]|uniref:receptor-type tyrosine-protein phosphatase eta isoform X2 n=1 Tax=Centropristis striata TaxID=184440 RepID=UPI0027DFC7B9|nr:receptor-type tyrosine-protein phosphatase eta isoform X2 [Centropristis striata]
MTLRPGVSLWALLLLSALLKSSQAECTSNTCGSDETGSLITTTTTTTVQVNQPANCNLTIGDNISGSGSLTGLTPGAVYQIFFQCLNCCKEATTKPNVVQSPDFTGVTTSSLTLTWTKPEGNSSSYIVEWTCGNINCTDNVTGTSKTITGLTPGVNYSMSVSAVADDRSTEGEKVTVSQYTKPGQIGELDVSTNTSSISLNWTAPPGEVFRYRVEWHNNGMLMNESTNDTFAVLSHLIPGTSYTITVTAIAGDSQTEGQAKTTTAVTKPDVVRNLSFTGITTSSVSLSWTEPEGSATGYTVQWTEEGQTFKNTTIETFFSINNLTPGTQYNITVAAVAVDPSNEGEGTPRSTFTKPEKPEDINIVTRGTDSLEINWTLPRGRVDHYVVNISDYDHRHMYANTTTHTTFLFTGLLPGRVFFIKVTSVAGTFNAMSDKSSFATVPTPPGSITISQRTNSSLYLTWAPPALMQRAPNISYHISYQPEGGEVQNKSAVVNSAELSPLLSGTSYNITVQTVGPENLTSTVVRDSAFTLPNPVLNLVASPKSTTSVTVEWSYPQGAQSYYRYLVYYSTAGEVNNVNISSNSTDVTGLEPGTRYNINVSTIAAAESESTMEQTFSYTMPKAVTNLRVEFVNTTVIRLMWQRQSDHKPSYSYLVKALQDGMVVVDDTTEAEAFTFCHLTPGKLYTFKVFTVVAGVKSEVETTSNYTLPEAVSDITAIGTTTNMTVSWTPAVGQVDSYTVRLYRDTQLVGSSTALGNSTTEYNFPGLIPGVNYCAVVVTQSGCYEINSTVCNATFPNPPGPIMVQSQTVTSITFTWSVPEGMGHNQYNFSVSTSNGSVLTGNSWFLLDNLQSGSPYNISVVTVGVRDYESSAVTAENYTRPYSVINLRHTDITTNAVTLEWEQPESKATYKYVVQTTNGSSLFETKVVLDTRDTITGLLSGSNYSFTVTTQTADGTEAAPVTRSYFTRPYSIGSIKAETVNTTAVNLTWAPPLEYKPEYTYEVNTSGCVSQNKTLPLSADAAVISELTPGTQCTFCVFVRAADGIEGEANCTYPYTKPEAVQPSISSQGSNNSVLVSWAKPPGEVECYKVYLNSSSPQYDTLVELNSTHTSHWFHTLSAGMQYSAMVITFSGPFNASSEFFTNATFPNPPGQIKVLSKTNRSIDICWKKAPLMFGADFRYTLTIRSTQKENNSLTNNNTHLFSSLSSGTPYNISVATVGVMGFQSETVQFNMVTTRPFHVNSLTASTNEENITVKWDNPNEYKESYRYNLTWQRSQGSISVQIIKTNNFTIENLDPGSSYKIYVTTETSDGTEGYPVTILKCTNASPVMNFNCKGLNTAIGSLDLSWKKPKGQNSGFKIFVNNNEMDSISTCCKKTVLNLKHFTEYKVSVETQSCGLPSTPVSISCRTGITNPPIPENYSTLVKVGTIAYNKFSIDIDPSLMDNINGPITHVGVLVTNSPASDQLSNLTEYVGKTYAQWQAKDTPVYLAAVRDNIFQSRSAERHLTIEVGNGSKFEGYTNGALAATKKYQYAIVLFTILTPKQDLVDLSVSKVSVTELYPAVTLPQDPAVIYTAVGATFGIFCVLFIVLIGFIIYWKRVSNKESSDIQIHSMRSVAVRVEDYEAYYKKQKADSNCGFAEEFEDLKLVGTGQSKTNALTEYNKPKNRYNNVLPYDASRVKLSIIQGSPYDDYINANYMPGYNSRKEYIAAQGPLPATVSDFWRMVWEKNVQTLVMLTRCNEQGRVKCEQYWDDGTKHFNNITVTTTSDIPLEDWTIREFDIKNVKTAETRSVRQFHFTAWPDHGVPQTTELLISFRHLVREHMDQYSRHSPTVVHCSAGVGRTGTFIAIDHLIFQIERENIVDVYGIVHDLRMHRPLMVQTEDQYVFLNQCALDIIRSRTGTNVDLIYQNTAALSIYENVEPKKGYPKNGYRNA